VNQGPSIYDPLIYMDRGGTKSYHLFNHLGTTLALASPADGDRCRLGVRRVTPRLRGTLSLHPILRRDIDAPLLWGAPRFCTTWDESSQPAGAKSDCLPNVDRPGPLAPSGAAFCGVVQVSCGCASCTMVLAAACPAGPALAPKQTTGPVIRPRRGLSSEGGAGVGPALTAGVAAATPRGVRRRERYRPPWRLDPRARRVGRTRPRSLSQCPRRCTR